MKIENLTLNNFQSYADESLDFNDGVTLIHGQNGAGKSTLLRAIFAGLYQADATSEAAAEYDLADFVRRDAEEATVELTFSIGDVEYTVEWELSVTETDEGERKASTRACVLTSEVYDDPVEGVRDVRDAIENDLLGMGATEFANSVYVQQKRLSRLIDASERERKEILDSLLGFDQLDTYIERMKYARRPVKRARNSAQSRRQEVQERIDEYDESTLRDQRQQYTDTITQLESEVENWEENVADDQRMVDQIQSRLDEYESIADEIETLKDTLETKKDDRANLREEIESRRGTIEEKRDRIDTLRSEIDALDAGNDHTLDTADAAETTKGALDDDWEAAYERKQTVKNNVSRAQETVDRLETEHDEATATVEEAQTGRDYAKNAVESASETVAECESRVEEAVEARNEAAAEFLETSPNDVTDDTREQVEAERDDADEKREQLGNDQSELRAEKKQVVSQRKTLADDLTTAQDEYETLAQKVDLDDGETDPQDEFEAAVDEAAALGSTFGVDVTEDSLYTLLRDHLPELRRDLLDEYQDVMGEWGTTKADEQYYNRLLDTVDALPDGGQTAHEVDDADPAPLERGALADALAEAQTEMVDVETEVDGAEGRLADLDTLATCVARALQLRALANAASEIDEIQRRRSELADRIEEIETELERLDAEQQQLETRVETGDDVLQKFEMVADTRRELESAQDDKERAEDDLEEAVNELEEAQANVDELEADLEEARTTLDETRSELEDATAEMERVADHRDAAETAVEHYATINTLENEIETLQEGIGQRNERISSLSETISDIEAELDEKEDAVEKIDTLEEKLGQAQNNLQTSQTKKDEKQDELREAEANLIEVENELETLERERERAEALDEQIEWADDVVAELTEVIEQYETVKHNLRAQTLDLLNKYTNEVFSDLYHSESYVGVRIDGDYNIKLLDSGNELMDPDKGSGGEGVITNIALRAGVYRVIADQDQNGGAGLPPFILDEPTNHLDSVHLGEIESVIESIEDWDVPQIFLVSHREELIENADTEIYVDKDPATDASIAHVGGDPAEDPVPSGGDE